MDVSPMHQIIPAERAHIPAIVELWKELSDYVYEFDPHYKRSEDAHVKFERFLREVMESYKSLVLVAPEGKELVGFCIAYVTEHRVLHETKFGFISDIFVKGQYRGRGLGTEMIEETKKWFEELHIARIELRLSTKNKIGNAFWRKHGFIDYEYNMYYEK
jgi:ribosomal protein S18 acetylase RimI-like enzyme